MSTVFMVSIFLMALHKVECWVQAEWKHSPFFRWISALSVGRDLGEAVFLTFILWLFAGLVMGWLILLPPTGPVLALGVWGLTFVLEWHHLLRSFSRRGYYPGTATALLYVAFGPVYWYALLSFAMGT